MALVGEMLVHVDTLVSMLAEPRLSLARVREVANRIDEMESRADKIVAEHESASWSRSSRRRASDVSASLPGINSSICSSR